MVGFSYFKTSFYLLLTKTYKNGGRFCMKDSISVLRRMEHIVNAGKYNDQSMLCFLD